MKSTKVFFKIITKIQKEKQKKIKKAKHCGYYCHSQCNAYG